MFYVEVALFCAIEAVLVRLLVSVIRNSGKSAVPTVWRCSGGSHQLGMFYVEAALFWAIEAVLVTRIRRWTSRNYKRQQNLYFRGSLFQFHYA
jgi:hypothetical protein